MIDVNISMESNIFILAIFVLIVLFINYKYFGANERLYKEQVRNGFALINGEKYHVTKNITDEGIFYDFMSRTEYEVRRINYETEKNIIEKDEIETLEKTMFQALLDITQWKISNDFGKQSYSTKFCYDYEVRSWPDHKNHDFIFMWIIEYIASDFRLSIGDPFWTTHIKNSFYIKNLEISENLQHKLRDIGIQLIDGEYCINSKTYNLLSKECN